MELQTRNSGRRTACSRGERTRQNLIFAAIHLGAHQGYSTVPLRKINEYASSYNLSAVHFHFKDRHGFLNEIIKLIEDAWIAQPPPAPSQNVDSILQNVVYSLSYLQRALPWHDDIIRFITRLCLEDDAYTANAAEHLIGPRIKAVREAMQSACSDVPPDILDLRVSCAVLLLLITYSGFHRTCVQALESDRYSDEDIMPHVITMVAAMVTAPVPPSSRQSRKNCQALNGA